MKHERTILALIILIIGISLFGCGTTQTSVEKNEKAELLNEHIKNLKFKFNATYAYPLNYKSIYLSPYYDVRVSPDTINAYLPYYGRAYRAPMDSNEGGIKFESTKFEYDVEKGKKQGNWLITIHTKDTSRPFTLHFDLWDNGTGRLDVQDPDRQSISFQGIVEPRKKAK